MLPGALPGAPQASLMAVCQSPSTLRGHPLARLLAPTAGFGALLHEMIAPGHPLARFCAGPAYVCAHPAGELMPFGASQHEIRRGLADLGAVCEEGDVCRIRVLPAQLETMHGCLNADAVTSQALFDAGLHLASGLHGSLMRHLRNPFAEKIRAICRRVARSPER